MGNEQCTYRSHYVQKALQSNFATTVGRAKKIFFVHIEHEDGWTVNIDSNMKQKGLYPDDIEIMFNSEVERDFTELSRRLCGSKRVAIRRSEYDTVKEYILLQSIRTPAQIGRLERILAHAAEPSFMSECVSDRLPGGSEKDYWYRILRTVLKNNWADLGSCDCLFVKALSQVFDRMAPMLIETRGDLILPDSGVSQYVEWYAPRPRYWGEELRGTFDREYSAEESYDIAGKGGEILLFCCLPMDKNHALLLVDDAIRFQSVAPYPIPMEFFPPLRYNTRIAYRDYRGSDKNAGIDALKQHWSPEDMITLTRQYADRRTTDGLNLLALRGCDVGFSFNDLDGIRPFIHDERLMTGGSGQTSGMLDFMEDIDFSKDMPKEERTG